MTDYIYWQGINLIKCVRQFDSFTIKILKSSCGYSEYASIRILEKLMNAGSVELIGKYPSGGKGQPANHYVIDPYAVTKWRAIKTSYEHEKDKKKAANAEKNKQDIELLSITAVEQKEEFINGMVIVDKASIDGLGSELMMRFDSLLAGARA